jgi:catechol 2,3-dioxygenase-like lactoylglutathione lyase family enzyme
MYFGRVILCVVSLHVSHFDHIQIAAPAGCESAAREFYGVILGMAEIEKPAALRARGGCWFLCGSQQLHIGIEREFYPAKKAHPAFVVFDLNALHEELVARGIPVIEDDALPGERRFFSEDPWGNRLEFLEARK